MYRLAFAAVMLAAASAHAETISCPDLSAAVQIGVCPSEQELKWGYNGYCSDNARMYEKDGDTCASIENYKTLKDVVLWEVGEFQGYLPCGQSPEQIKATRPVGVSVSKAGAMTRIACTYDGGLVMAYRTKQACKVEGAQAVCN